MSKNRTLWKWLNIVLGTAFSFAVAFYLFVFWAQADKTAWSATLMGYTGFNYKVLINNPPHKTYVSVVPKAEEEFYLLCFRSRKKPYPEYSTLIYASHKQVPGTTQALLFANEQGSITACSVASMDYERLARLLNEQ